MLKNLIESNRIRRIEFSKSNRAYRTQETPIQLSTGTSSLAVHNVNQVFADVENILSSSAPATTSNPHAEANAPVAAPSPPDNTDDSESEYGSDINTFLDNMDSAAAASSGYNGGDVPNAVEPEDNSLFESN